MSPPNAATIAAVATPAGRGGIGVVRISGPDAVRVAEVVLGRSIPAPRRAAFLPFLDADGSPIDHGVVLHFAAPRSYTGEDTVELQGHGGPAVLDALLRRVVAAGARLARPGEFTERAYTNGRLDLVQAEAVADLIEAGSEAAARGAMRSLSGAFSLGPASGSSLASLIPIRTGSARIAFAAALSVSFSAELMSERRVAPPSIAGA